MGFSEAAFLKYLKNFRITELENTIRDKDLQNETLRHEIDELSKKSQEGARPEHEQVSSLSNQHVLKMGK